MTRPTVSAREWRLVLLFGLAVVALTTLPYVVAWNAQGDEWHFSGYLFGVEDGYSYLAKMRLGVRGVWDFYLFYTPEPHDSAPLVYMAYIAPGHLVGLFTGTDNPVLPATLAVVLHTMRVSFDLLLIAVIYRFVAAFVRPVRVRLVALALATLGGGFGWLLALAGAGNAPEFYIPEGFTFLILFGIPHLALARAALLGGLLLLMHAHDGIRPARSVVLAAACWWLVGIVLPFFMGIAYMILGVWGITLWRIQRRFPWRFARLSVVVFGLTVPLLVYFIAIFSTNEAMAIWLAQNHLPAPPPLHYLLAYAVVGLPALLGLRAAWRRAQRDAQFALLVGWAVAGLLLVYAPVNVQRRLGEGVLVPLAILAALGLWTHAQTWALRRSGRVAARRFVALALPVVALASVSTLLLWLGSFGAASIARPPLFRPAAEVAAFEWLNRLAETDAVVLAPVGSANALPAFADVRTFMGHGPETLHWPEKTEAVRRFFSGEMTAQERAALIADFAVAYVLATPEQAGASPWSDGLLLRYEAAGYRIYETGVSSAER